MHHPEIVRRIRWLTALFILGLAFSGATAIPLLPEIDWLVKVIHADPGAGGFPFLGIGPWLLKVRAALQAVARDYPFVAYGFDWLAFGHFAIAIAFVGALLDPVRNRWLFTFGMIACVLVIPYAFVFGEIRGIPIGWRLIDCSFGVFGFVPLWYCRKWARQLERDKEI